MSKVYKIVGNETGYEYEMTFYNDVMEINYMRNGRYRMLYCSSGDFENQYSLDKDRFVEAMFEEIRECGSLEEARDMATIAFEAEGLFDYVFENWGCPDCEY